MSIPFSPATSAARISARGISSGYGKEKIINTLDVDIPRGAVTTVIGPNGCGKSTLLRTLSRLLPTTSGTIALDGTDISTLSRKEIAKTLSVLPQSPLAPEGLLVSDLVSRGRHPHQSWYRQWNKEDQQAVTEALRLTNTDHLAERTVDSLSGGQRQRVWISLVLAQNTDLVFLDEPTTYLDLAHSIEILELVGRLRSQEQKTIVMVLHDLNLAIRYSDHLIVMKDGQIITTGTPAHVITSGLLKEVFGLSAIVVADPVTGGPLVVPTQPEQTQSELESHAVGAEK
ncbi:ABC transporter ATP-binding protein [Corynebacterium sp. sy017]|uniref:ABC transporter ATP-binding protein n=1 Tax=unclassified Corynebacterium TaxID=2624378 RepID=UPI00118613E2|nr:MULTISPECIES: ABC transporter ATP-binding protein [unclassified Corynebacterium]MBP3088810.1 ABC transporter ATP-binding protein [Corynebacterium sp. sy017]QDZ42201.1 ABC transporter ATP-binding protein [Corynebacterium sp. sy039]TSD91153.1 ABC transporter ATP-binding protein [Corynebacterium sp. SY003]